MTVVALIAFLTAVQLVPTALGARSPRPAAIAGEALRDQQTLARLIARGLPVFCAGGNRREVALSFDDGPDAYSWQLLSELHGLAPATFFVIGEAASEYPRVVRADALQGAVGDHTQTHAVLTRLSASAAQSEIAQGKKSVEAAAGKQVQLFRPPNDQWDAAIDAMVREQGMLSVGYTVDPRDWALGTPAQVRAAVLSDPRLVPGAIVLLHEMRLSTVEAVPTIITALRRRGLKLVTVPQLLADDPPTLAEQEADLRARSCAHLYQRRFASSRQRGRRRV